MLLWNGMMMEMGRIILSYPIYALLYTASNSQAALEEVRLISLEASYMKDIGEFELMESSLQEGFQICRRIADPHQQGRGLPKMGKIIGHIAPDRPGSCS